MLARLLKQQRPLGEVAAELAGEAQFGEFGGHAQPHTEPQIGGRFPRIIAAGGDDLFQFLDTVEAEGFHPMHTISLADRAGRLDRVHEAQHRFGQDAAHQPHLSDRGDVVMRDPGVPQHAQQLGRGIGLHRIERAAGKLLNEKARRTRGGVRTVEDNGFVGRERAYYGPGVGIGVQIKGPPKRFDT